jgi:signal transduction histidine kinase
MASRTWAHWLIASDRGSLRDRLRSVSARHGIVATWLVPGIYAGCLAAFVTDLTSSDTLAFGVFYVPLVATAVFHRDKRAVWVLAGVACAMVVIGTFIPNLAPDLRSLIWNRSLSICAVLATALFVWRARTIQDQLAEQTHRAEAAERIKTEVLTNLSQEIRSPLHSMIGVLELVAAGGRADQISALNMVRTSGRRLVATVDNLVDLTQFQEQSLPAESLDLGQLLRQIVEAKRQEAAFRQITLTVDIPSECDMMVHANPWAVRRILENKIGDGITYTSPGGRISATASVEKCHVSAVIVASGTWPQRAFQAVSEADVSPLMPSVMGLALSQRLARAIDARLTFSNGPDEGTTITLRLPASEDRVERPLKARNADGRATS